jgi:hypothetical protein
MGEVFIMNRKLQLLIIGLAAAFAATGCGGGGGDRMGYQSPTPTPMPAPTPTPTPPPPPSGEGFTEWSKVGVFMQPENIAPVVMDTLVFNFDGDDNPNAYSDLLPPG